VFINRDKDVQGGHTKSMQRSDGQDTLALIGGCARRPADEAAWKEFVRRYHPTILAAVSLVLRSKKWRNEAVSHCSEEIIDDLVQTVYLKR
jgi:hypothetical protein